MSSKPLISFETLAEGHPYFFDTEEPPDWNAEFGNHRPVHLEIGFGTGNFLLEMAIREPDYNFVGMDFYHKGIRRVITRVDKLLIKNIRIVYGDAREKVPVLFKDGQLGAVFINFPDPWPKKRHGKRRLIKPQFVRTLSEKLVPGGVVRVATDDEPYAMEMLSYFEGEPTLKNKIAPMAFAPTREDTPRTKYEKHFINAGEKIYYLDFIKE
ncbi:MAG: tRNA (guanosine(46)-N7)-methyltransferase TrmB [Nitrospinae bacterium]|nr:tRNA (guanosine(46)-N7)-methyltransferase TrmB [Nitrospinota bacterium]